MPTQAKGERNKLSKWFYDFNNEPFYTARGTTAWGLFVASMVLPESRMKWIFYITFVLVFSLVVLREKKPQ